MSVLRLSARYSKSLLDHATELGKVEEVHQDMHFFRTLIAESNDFRLMLKSPIIKTDKKIKILEIILLGRVDDITLRFIRILTKKRREPYLIDIADSFIRHYNIINGITPMKLTTASEIPKESKNEILSAFKEKEGIDIIELTSKIEEDLIGGFILQFDDKLYDASISRQLNILKKEFIDTSYIKNF